MVAGEVKREKKIKREGGERENALALQAIALYVPSLEMKEIRDGEEERNAFDIVSTAFTFLRLLPLSFLLSLSATLASLRSPPPSLFFLRLSLSHSSCLRYLAYNPTVAVSVAYKVARHFIASVIFSFITSRTQRRDRMATPVFMDAITVHPESVRALASTIDKPDVKRSSEWLPYNSKAKAVSLGRSSGNSAGDRGFKRKS